MFTFKFDKSNLNFDDIVAGLHSRFQAAIAFAMTDLDAQARRMANERLKSTSARNHWNRGFKIDKVTEDYYIISVEGTLANWMEQGMDVGEVSKSILSGNRMESNRGQNKNYVDVPIAKDADAAGSISLGKSGKPTINIKAFKDADSLIREINTSNWKSGGTKKEQVLTRRVNDIIHSFKTQNKQVHHSYLTVRRVSENSQPWPKTPFAGANVLEDLGLYLDQNIDKILEQYL